VFGLIVVVPCKSKSLGVSFEGREWVEIAVLVGYHGASLDIEWIATVFIVCSISLLCRVVFIVFTVERHLCPAGFSRKIPMYGPLEPDEMCS
jgi:hypothetical protein